MAYWHLPLCRNKSSCEIIHMEMFSFHAKETNFHIKGFVRSVSIVVTLDLKMLFKTLVTVFHIYGLTQSRTIDERADRIARELGTSAKRKT